MTKITRVNFELRMVGAAGIEPTTSSPPDLRDTTTLRPDYYSLR